MVPDGDPATLAVVDQIGTIVAAGRSVMRAAWDVPIRAYRIFLIENSHLRVLSKPPMMKHPAALRRRSQFSIRCLLLPCAAIGL